MKPFLNLLFINLFCSIIASCTSISNNSPPLSLILTPVSLDLVNRPDFIMGVTPKEGSRISSETYILNEYQGVNPNFELDFLLVDLPEAAKGFNSTICVKFQLHLLVQKGDYFNDLESVANHLRLVVNGEDQSNIIVEFSETMGFYRGDVENPEATWGGPDYIFCWLVPLEVGVHPVAFSFRQSSGTVQQYEWYFTIVEDSEIP